MALAALWIAAAIEEHGIGGAPDTITFALQGAHLVESVGQALVESGHAPQGSSPAKAVGYVLGTSPNPVSRATEMARDTLRSCPTAHAVSSP